MTNQERITFAAVLIEQNKPLILEELYVPELQAGQVLVDICYAGVCRSQVNEIQGLKGPDRFLPHTLGHEGSGIVSEVAQGVTKVKVGDRVVLTWIKGAGADVAGAVYKRKDGSSVNSGAISTFLTRAVISENRLVVFPESLDFSLASLLGCAVPTGAGIVKNTAKVTEESTIAIFGVGGIGMSALLAAHMLKAKKIIAIDVEDEKLSLAKSLGAHHIINARNENVLDCILKNTQGLGVDFSVEAAGRVAPMEQAFLAVRDFGGLAILAGNPKVGEHISIDPFHLIKGKQIVGSWGGATDPDRDIPFYVDKHLSGCLPLKELISDIFSLEEINLAIQTLISGKSARILIKM